ncbi:LysR family transcriptional regulator [Roseateles terrae]|uniref:DNA-binding transcriptional LysR family regulator n=1 Tax=Roseateles terrae TaxID=431060 RepID=A0ABR6GMY9_9BURK|nr:LysR family transcriptional regulator [Roseateles terrae]MBB3193081.1 DNA-binding transcriptional LysR family regulator [Roseateles terrae]OWQ89684.1 LysR family transcriptional regulator [Roseateles terrae]
MDITLAQTFLEIVASGSFVRAAENLHITQTAVSARVRTLEEHLDAKLFVRNKAGATLTHAGEQFTRHAAMLVQIWQRARHQVALPPGRESIITIGCELSLWDPLLQDWLLHMRTAAPHLALRTEVGHSDALIDRVASGTLDVAVVYAPQLRPGLRIELLLEEKLVLVTTREDATLRPEEYVYVDWGPEFAAQHGLAFPHLVNAGISVGLGPLGREYVLAAGGTAYFRLQVVTPYLRSGRMHRIPGAPEFLYPAYAVFAEGADMAVVRPALEGLRAVMNPGGAAMTTTTATATGTTAASTTATSATAMPSPPPPASA